MVLGFWSIGSRSTELLDSEYVRKNSEVGFLGMFIGICFEIIHWPVSWYTKKAEIAERYYDQMGYVDFERKYSAHNTYLQSLADRVIGLLSTITILFCLTQASMLVIRYWGGICTRHHCHLYTYSWNDAEYTKR